MNKLICMAFDGDYVTEGEFETVDQAWKRSEDMGSHWYFYPFHFVTTASGETVKDAPDLLKRFVGKSVKSVSAKLKEFAEALKDDDDDVDGEQFEQMLYYAE